MTEQTKRDGSTRWWEFYAIRYAMGTVVGAIVFYLLCQASPTLQPLLFNTIGTDAGTGKAVPTPSVDATRLTLLAAYGLIYCYIASAPVLVFHAGRFLLKLDTSLRTKIKWLALCLSLPAAVAVLTHLLSSSRSAAERVLYMASFSALALILWLQIVVVSRTLFHNAELYKFYAQLAARRERATGEITDSYRHLREHGNSFFIVFLEIVLALILFSAGNLTPLLATKNSMTANAWVFLVIVVAWILPSVFVWVIATVFERRFSESEIEQTHAADSA